MIAPQLLLPLIIGGKLLKHRQDEKAAEKQALQTNALIQAFTTGKPLANAMDGDVVDSTVTMPSATTTVTGRPQATVVPKTLSFKPGEKPTISLGRHEPTTQEMDAYFAGIYNEKLARPNANPVTALFDAIAESNYAPSGWLNKSELTPQQRDATYWKMYLSATASPQFRAEVQGSTGLKGVALDNAVKTLAMQFVARETGHIPEQAMPFVLPQENQVTPEIQQELTALNLPITPANVLAAQESINARELRQEAALTTGEVIAEEAGEQVISGEKILRETESAKELAKAAVEGGEAGKQAIRDIKLSREAYEKVYMAGVQPTLESLKPISAKDRAKHGIGTLFSTYEELANRGFRFATIDDRKTYQRITAIKAMIESLESLMFGPDGVFTGVGNDTISRRTSAVWLAGVRARGTQRGRNAEVYKNQLVLVARRLANLAGETGSRFSDQDIATIIPVAPSVGTLRMDGEDLARQKYERLVVELNRQLKQSLEGIVLTPMGQPGTEKKATHRFNPTTGKLEVIQ